MRNWSDSISRKLGFWLCVEHYLRSKIGQDLIRPGFTQRKADMLVETNHLSDRRLLRWPQVKSDALLT